jgi:uncharacterized membrane protein YdjX (TVP38/TMEM64 family)
MDRNSLRSSFFRIFGLIFIIIVIWYLNVHTSINKEYIESIFSKYPVFWQWFIFIFCYTVLTFFIWSLKDPLKIISALVFGAYTSTILIWVSEIINSFVIFYCARYLVRGLFQKQIKETFFSLDEKISKTNLIWLFLLRFAPLIPNRILDSAVGLTKISYKKYLFIVVVASPLRIFCVQYVLSAVGEMVFKDPFKLVGYFQDNPHLTQIGLIYFIISIIMVIFLKKRFK